MENGEGENSQGKIQKDKKVYDVHLRPITLRNLIGELTAIENQEIERMQDQPEDQKIIDTAKLFKVRSILDSISGKNTPVKDDSRIRTPLSLEVVKFFKNELPYSTDVARNRFLSELKDEVQGDFDRARGLRLTLKDEFEEVSGGIRRSASQVAKILRSVLARSKAS